MPISYAASTNVISFTLPCLLTQLLFLKLPCLQACRHLITICMSVGVGIRPQHRNFMLHLLRTLCSAYLTGDPIPMMRRTQHSGQRSAWHEVPSRELPRFLQNRLVVVRADRSPRPALALLHDAARFKQSRVPPVPL